MNLEESFKLIDEGKESIRSLAKKFGIPKSTLHRWYKKWKEERSKTISEELPKAIDKDELRREIEEIALRIATEVAKKSSEELEKTVKSFLSSLDPKLKQVESELALLKEKLEQKEVEEREIEIEGSKIRKTVELSPMTLQYYDYYIAKTGTNISLGEFIDEVVDEHFRECLGIEVAVIVRPESKLSKK